MRDGQTWADAVDEKESYDLVVVGGGISGLAAAHGLPRVSLTLNPGYGPRHLTIHHKEILHQ